MRQEGLYRNYPTAKAALIKKELKKAVMRIFKPDSSLFHHSQPKIDLKKRNDEKKARQESRDKRDHFMRVLNQTRMSKNQGLSSFKGYEMSKLDKAPRNVLPRELVCVPLNTQSDVITQSSKGKMQTSPSQTHEDAINKGRSYVKNSKMQSSTLEKLIQTEQQISTCSDEHDSSSDLYMKPERTMSFGVHRKTNTPSAFVTQE